MPYCDNLSSDSRGFPDIGVHLALRLDKMNTVSGSVGLFIRRHGRWRKPIDSGIFWSGWEFVEEYFCGGHNIFSTPIPVLYKIPRLVFHFGFLTTSGLVFLRIDESEVGFFYRSTRYPVRELYHLRIGLHSSQRSGSTDAASGCIVA